MIVDRAAGTIRHACFRDLPSFLRHGDRLVLNQTRVIPARFGLRRQTGGRIGGLFLSESRTGRWRAMLAGGGRLKIGESLQLERGRHTLTVVEAVGDGEFELELEPPAPAAQVLAAVGRAPLPPYIRRDAESGYSDDLRDKLEYQTVYAREPGAVAAPTAGLHFTPELLDRLATGGVERSFVTLHVGRGTFRPVAVDDLTAHPMHAEWYELPRATVAELATVRAAGGRIVAVGTTSVRVLESCASDAGLRAGSGWTRLLIQPPYEFRAVDALITNFHLPRSTLLALVYAFGGTGLIRRAYADAIASGYRFYSFGDAMLIV